MNDRTTPLLQRRTFLQAAGALFAMVLTGCGVRRSPLQVTGDVVPAAIGMPGQDPPASPAPPPPAPDLSDVFSKPKTARARRVVEVIAREGWGATRPKRPYRPQQVTRMTVHHSATVLKNNSDAPAHFRLYQRIHKRKRPDIAYHLLIDRKGNIYEGRPVLASGESTSRKHGYDASGHLLVMLDGNFEVQRPSRKQLAALADVFAWAALRLQVDPGTITGHRDHAPTACPGRNLYRHVTSGTLQSAVRDRIAKGGVDLVLVEGKTAKRRVAVIEGA